MTFSSQNNSLTHADMPSNVSEMNSAALTRDKLQEQLMNKRINGLYRLPFTYEMQLNEDGTLWGRNNYGTEDVGKWTISDTGEMTVSWQSYWDAHTTRVYLENGVLHLFDIDTGNWRTSMFEQ